MISVISSPNANVYSKNDIVFKFQTDNYFTTAGISAQKDFYVAPAIGDTLTIAWGSESIIFTAAAALDNTGTKVRYFSDTNTQANINNYLQYKLMLDIMSNELLVETFDIYYEQPSTVGYIRLKAKTAGPDYNLTITYTSTTGGTANAVTGVAAVVKDNFKIVAELFTFPAKGIALQKICSLEEIPDSSSQVYFNFCTILDRYLSSLGGDAPTYNQAAISLCSQNMLRFVVRYREAYGDPVADYGAQVFSYRFAIYGGIKKENYNGYSFPQLSSGTTQPFLSWMPLSREISRTEQQYLYFLFANANTSDTMSLYADFTFSDGTTSSGNIYNYNVTDQCILKIPAGFSQLNLAMYESAGVTITKYSLYLKNVFGLQVSEKREYVIDNTTYENERFFIYLNSLGGYDTIRFIGDAELTQAVKYDLSQAILTPGYTSRNGENKKINISYSETLTVGSGLLDKEFKTALEDLLCSREVYEIIGGKFVSIIVQNNDEKIYNDGDDLHPIILKYNYNFNNTAFDTILTD